LGLRRDNRDDRGVDHHHFRRPVPAGHGVQHEPGFQPDGPQQCLHAVLPQGHDRHRARAAADRAGLPGLDLLRIPPPDQRQVVQVGCSDDAAARGVRDHGDGRAPGRSHRVTAGRKRQGAAPGPPPALAATAAQDRRQQARRPGMTETAGPGSRAGRPRPFDPRLLRYARAARGYLIITIALGLVTTGLILAQASLLARALSGAALGTGLAALRGTLITLAVVLVARAAASFGAEAAALRAAASVKSQLRRALTARALRLGPSWLTGQQAGEITALATKGLDALDPYFARYLPQLVLGCLVPLAVLARVAVADWISALVIAGTRPLIPVFAVLVGLHTKAHTQRQGRLLAALSGHFLDVVAGLPTLKLFGRAKAQAEAIRSATDQHRSATMAGLRVAFLSALVLELAAALATALVAVEIGLRLLAGRVGYDTALLVLLLTPEAYLPLRNVGAQFHASAEGTAAAGRVFEILQTPLAAGPPASLRQGRVPDLAAQPVRLSEVTLRYPGRDHAALAEISLSIEPGEHVLVTGPSGAGKSSLFALLLRFAQPTAG